jgi:hypothetical protein
MQRIMGGLYGGDICRGDYMGRGYLRKEKIYVYGGKYGGEHRRGWRQMNL